MNTSQDNTILQQLISTTTYDVVVVGAGPYGLSTAAYLQSRGISVAVFGKPLQLWRENMPRKMLLRSTWWATSISDPGRQYDLEHYFRETNQLAFDHLPVETLIAYGLWFQKHAVPNVDETFVHTVEHANGQFVVTLADGRVIHSAAVVMAPGLHYYAYRPCEYRSLPSELVSHTSEHYTFDRFTGKAVVIIGGGQSALETAALAHESGVDVQVVSRRPIVWIRESPPVEHRSLIKCILNPKAGIGYGWINWQFEHLPYLFQRLPLSLREILMSGHGIARYGPIGAPWLKSRTVGKVPLHEGQHVQQLQEVNDRVVLTLSNKQVLKADHIILGTGYRVDIKNLPMLHPSLLSHIRIYHDAPVLNNCFESTVPGLYFVGFSSVPCFGPLYRFILGTKAAARRVTNAIAAHKRQEAKANYAYGKLQGHAS